MNPQAALAGRNDPDAIREAVTTVLSPRLQDVTDPNARAEFQEAGIRILAGGLDQLRSEHKVSDAETAKAIKDLAGRITRLSQETQKVMASVEQLKEELKYQQELLNQLIEAMGQTARKAALDASSLRSTMMGSNEMRFSYKAMSALWQKDASGWK